MMGVSAVVRMSMPGTSPRSELLRSAPAPLTTLTQDLPALHLQQQVCAQMTAESLRQLCACRGITRDQIMGVLHTMAQELPAAVPRMLQWASKNACDVRVMSDCNSVVISHILKGAGPPCFH